MAAIAESKTDVKQPETRKEWIAPELKKVDLVQITATGGRNKADKTFES